MVSVIIPVYNVQNYIVSCLESVIGQTYTDIEVLLINDGSTDGSETICEEYAEKEVRIRYIKTEHHGVSDARNTGLKLCKGEYISFVDSDDRLHPQAIEFMMKALQEHRAPIVKSDFCRIPDGENPAFTLYEYVNTSIRVQECFVEIKQSFTDELLRSIWGALYSRESVEGILF